MFSNRSSLTAVLLHALILAGLPGSRAAASESEQLEAKASVQSSLPPYEFPFENGLYASAAGYLCVKNVCFPCERSYPLDVDCFCGKFPVKGVIQEGSAPLVVVLLGIGGRPEEDFSKLWPSWFACAGYHVLTFESTFLQDFNTRSQHGVTGNMWAETNLVKQIIDAFLKQTCVNGRVSKIGIVGLSYGGVESLMLGTMAAQKKLPFEIDAIQAYSPPINMEHSAEIVDRFYAETRDKYTLLELLQLQHHVPDRSNPNSPIPDDMLKAAVSATFRLPLPALIAYNDRNYHLHQLPKGDEFEDQYVREAYARKWTFTGFAYGMSYPYWQRKLNLPSLEPMIEAAHLPSLVAHQPPISEVILAEDDPLDSRADMEALKAFSTGKRITILPRGGHLGFIDEPWTKAKLLSIFDNAKPIQATAVVGISAAQEPKVAR
jgi:predicted alpha/beta-fold hydrolase